MNLKKLLIIDLSFTLKFMQFTITFTRAKRRCAASSRSEAYHGRPERSPNEPGPIARNAGGWTVRPEGGPLPPSINP